MMATSSFLAPFWHGLAKPKPVWRDTFRKTSLHAGFWSKRARRETSFPASLRALVANWRTGPPRMAISRRFRLVTCANKRTRLSRRAISRRFRLVTCASWRSGHDICGEKHCEKLLSAQVSAGNVRREKRFQKLTSARVSASPSNAKKGPSHTQLVAPHPVRVPVSLCA